MKILWFTNTPCGAAGRLGLHLHLGGWLTSLEAALVKQPGIDLHVCFYWGAQMEPFRYNETTYHPVLRSGSNSKTGRLVNRILGNQDDNADVTKLQSVVDAVKPDLIHVHGTENNFGLVLGKTAVPAVVSMQGIVSPYYEKFFAGIPGSVARRFEGLKPKLLYRSASYLSKDLYKAAQREQQIFTYTKAVIGRTGWDKRVCKLLSPESRYYEGNELLRASFYSGQWQKPGFGDTIKLVTIMSGALYKGLETVVKTARLLGRYWNKPFEWTIIGQQETNDVPGIVRRWLKTDYQSVNIKFAGSKTEEEVKQLMLEADLYCQVSHIENSPNSLCEAMLLGMPIIATYAGGTDSMLTHGTEGILVQSGDPYSMAGAVIEMASGFESAMEAGLRARQRALVRHNSGNIVGDLLHTYQDILKPRQ